MITESRGGSEQLDSSNPISTHSGTGEKETLNITVVGTMFELHVSKHAKSN